MNTTASAPTTNERLLAWVGEVASLTEPDDIHWCDGSAEEYDSLCQTLVDAGTFERLSDAKRPNSYLALSDPDDVARVEGRTMYVVPFSMGPLGSDHSYVGVQLTDSVYVAVSMRIMTRMGQGALDALGSEGDFVPCLHSVGMPLLDDAEDVPWPCNSEDKYICLLYTSPSPRDGLLSRMPSS